MTQMLLLYHVLIQSYEYKIWLLCMNIILCAWLLICDSEQFVYFQKAVSYQEFGNNSEYFFPTVHFPFSKWIQCLM